MVPEKCTWASEGLHSLQERYFLNSLKGDYVGNSIGDYYRGLL